MFIMPNKIFFKQDIAQSQQVSNLPKLKTLNKDTVSFSAIKDFQQPSKNLQLYRCIGESELNALLEGKKIKNDYGAYATSDPRGWRANSWHNGFNSRKENTYFVTFKTDDENLQMEDRRDSDEDTRYAVISYNLDNVKNIRKGNNAHGELIWSADIENDKLLDKENKFKKVNCLIDDLRELMDCENNYKQKIGKIYDELGSYAKEFPEIIDKLKPLSKNNNQFLSMLLDIISDADRQEDWSFVKNKLQNCSNNGIRTDNIYLIDYIEKHACDEDVQLLLNIAQNDPNATNCIGYILNKIATPMSHDIIKETYWNSNSRTQCNLIEYFENKEDGHDIARFTLEKYKNQQNKILNNNDSHDLKLISKCINILGEQGSKDDIPLLEEYTQGNSSYFNYEIKSAINKLNQQKK